MNKNMLYSKKPG